MARPVWTLDCETDPFKVGRVPAPFIWDVFDGAQHHIFKTPLEVIQFLFDKRVIVYAHNGGKFDYHYLLQYLMPDDEIMVINGRLAKFTIGICEFRDSFNIMPVPLAQYQKTKIDYAKFEKATRKKYMREIIDYLKDDCVYLWELVNGFKEEYGLALTQAGASMRIWGKIAGDSPPRSDAEYYEYFSAFYYGGRVECFESGDITTDFEVFDINSAYPFAMLKDHPYGLEHERLTKYDIFTEDDDITGPGLFRIRARSTGAFPFRADDRLNFPRDNVTREFTVTGWELLAARDTGTLHNYTLIECFLFTECRNFNEFITYFYAKRREAKAEGDKAGDLFAKLLMNGLYGKFAANPEKYSRYWPCDTDQIEYMESEKGRSFNGFIGPWALMAKDLAEEKRRYYNVATSASITGFVRAMLWRAIHKCDRVLYCDTDSLAVVGKARIPMSQKLGDWETEGKFMRACIAGKKLYAFRRAGKLKEGVPRWKVRSKGVRLTYQEIIKVCNGESVIAKPIAPTYTIFKPPFFNNRLIKMTA